MKRPENVSYGSHCSGRPVGSPRTSQLAAVLLACFLVGLTLGRLGGRIHLHHYSKTSTQVYLVDATPVNDIPTHAMPMCFSAPPPRVGSLSALSPLAFPPLAARAHRTDLIAPRLLRAPPIDPI